MASGPISIVPRLGGVLSTEFVKVSGGTPAIGQVLTAGDVAGNLVWEDLLAVSTDIAHISAVPRWFKFTLTHSDFACAGTTGAALVTTLPAGGQITAMKACHTESFTGGSISTYAITVLPAFIVADVFQAPNGVALFHGIAGVERAISQSTPVAFEISAESTGGNLNTATAGSLDIWVLASVSL